MQHYITKRNVYPGQDLVIHRERGAVGGFTYVAEFMGSIGEGSTPDLARLDLMRGLVFDGKGDEKAVHSLWQFGVRNQWRSLRHLKAERAVELLRAEIRGETPDWVRREYGALLYGEHSRKTA